MNTFSIMTKAAIIAMGMAGIAYAEHDASNVSLLNNKWTGFYASVNGGVVFNNAELRSAQLGFTNPSDTCNTSADFSSFSPGIEVGYLH
jgi:outer membrane immunogenic protein